MEAVVLGIPGIAFSFASRRDDLMVGYKDLVAALVKRITAHGEIPPNTLLNINLPGIPVDQVKGVRVAKLGSRVFTESVTKQQDPWGRDVFWIGGGKMTWTDDADTDHAAVSAGYVSITPLQLDLTSHALLDSVRGWRLED